MNISHTVAEADQEISYLADQIHQVDDEVQSSRLVEIVFLNSLSKEYESFHQLLEFHAKNLNQMIKILSVTEARIKDENETLYSMNIAMKTARRFKNEWVKKAMCYNCEKVEHLSKSCKKLKKIQKNDENSDFNDEKIKDKKINKKISEKIRWSNNQAKKTQQQQAQAAKEDLESASDSDEDLKICLLARENKNKNKNETAKNEITDENAYQAKTDSH